MTGNLLDNAFEAVVCSQGPKRVGFEIKHDKNSYIIYVYNSGPRIPDRLKKDFPSWLYHKRSGARGYGLYLVKKLVEEYGAILKLYPGQNHIHHIFTGWGGMENDKDYLRNMAEKLGKQLQCDQDRVEVFAYGLQIILGTGFKLVLILLISLILDTFHTTLICLITYIAFRNFGEGFI